MSYSVAYPVEPMLKPANEVQRGRTMFTILRATLAKFKGKWGEFDPALRFLLYCEIGFYLFIGFTIFIWQPEFLTE